MKARHGLPALTLALTLVVSACGRSNSTTAPTTNAPSGSTTSTLASKCKSEVLKKTEVGVTADTITIDVMADVNSPLAPGLFKGNWDAMKAWATYVNAHGGVGCRNVVVNTLDSKLDDAKAADGNIQACKEAVAKVGGNTLFNTKAADDAKCADISGKATGIPDLVGLANDVNELCSPMTYSVQFWAETCPVKATGSRTIKAMVGFPKYLLSKFPGLHGLYLIPGDLPTTRQSAVAIIESMKQAGFKWDATSLVSGLAPQSAFDKYTQLMKTNKSDFVYDGSNDAAMIKMRKEAKAQGVDGQVKVWACSLACYSQPMLQAASDVEGTYVWMQFLPFEEANLNADDKAYVDGVGGLANTTSFGAQAFMAGQAFKKVVDGIVEKSGPNAITREAILDGLKNLGGFDSNGWMGKKELRGTSSCVVVMQIKGGKYVRAFPEKPGTMDCNDANFTTVTVDPTKVSETFN